GWDVPVDGRVVGVAAVGDAGLAAVSVDRGTSGGVILLDAATGAIRAELSVPRAPTGVTAGRSGTVLGVALPDEARFYDLSREG
ncbi:MAG: hypothetical protein ABMB14_27310, partial [Myxococcota bacterium]